MSTVVVQDQAHIAILRAMRNEGSMLGVPTELAALDAAIDALATLPHLAPAAGADRTAIKLLVAAGFVTEAKANEALQIAHGFERGPLAQTAAEGVMATVVAEIERATRKFPTWPTDPLHACGVVQEESGELAKAVLQAVYEPHKSTLEDVRDEAIQTAAMAIRFVVSLDRYDWAPGAQHLQAGAAQRPAAVDGGSPRVEVRRIQCDCHPETCCCAEAELLVNGKRIASGDLDALRTVASLGAAQQEVRGG